MELVTRSSERMLSHRTCTRRHRKGKGAHLRVAGFGEDTARNTSLRAQAGPKWMNILSDIDSLVVE